MTIKVAIAGAGGRMGREVVRAVAAQSDMRLVGAVDPRELGVDAGELAGIGPMGVRCVISLSELSAADVLVDFTVPSSARSNTLIALERGMRPVVGTTGLEADGLAAIDELARKQNLGAVVAPNFAIGAVLLMKFAVEASRYMPNAEIIELHHNQKVDAPSGTALKTAQLMLAAQPAFGADNVNEFETVAGARGAEMGGIHLHSIRLPGLVAHQEVIFGGLGQTLTLRHDSMSRESFMPGVMLAIREVRSRVGLIYGLEHLL